MSERGECAHGSSHNAGASVSNGPSGGSAATAEMGPGLTQPGAGDWMDEPVTRYPH